MTRETPHCAPRACVLALAAGLWGVAGCATSGRTLAPPPRATPAPRPAATPQQLARGEGWVRLQVDGEELVQVQGRRGLQRAPLPDDVRGALLRDPFLRASPGTPLYVGARLVDEALARTRERCALERNATCAESMRERLVRADAACEDVEVEQQLWRDLAVREEGVVGALAWEARVDGRVHARVRYREKRLSGVGGRCETVGFYLLPVTVAGTPRLTLARLQLDARGAARDAEALAWSAPRHEAVFRVGVLPVRVALDVALHAGLHQALEGEGRLAASASAVLPADFSYTCDLARRDAGACLGSVDVEGARVQALEGNAAGVRGAALPWVAATVRVGLYGDAGDGASVALQPYVQLAPAQGPLDVELGVLARAGVGAAAASAGPTATGLHPLDAVAFRARSGEGATLTRLEGATRRTVVPAVLRRPARARAKAKAPAPEEAPSAVGVPLAPLS